MANQIQSSVAGKLLAEFKFGYTQTDYLDEPSQALKSAIALQAKLGPHNRFAVFGDYYLDAFTASELEGQNLTT